MTQTHPDLAALLRGELSNATTLEAAAHVRGCDVCRGDLVEVSAGHGLLTAARRVEASGTSHGLAAPAPVSGPVPDPASGPDSGPVSGPVSGPGFPPRLRREVRRARWLRPTVAAATVVALSAAGATALLTGGPENDPPAARPAEADARTAALEPVDPPPGPRTDGVGGRVSMTSDAELLTMRIDTVALPRAGRGQFYYVWLLDPASNKMLPLGQMTPGHRARFDLPESLVEAYSAIDVSLEADDGDPGHSVTSVLRATYAESALDPSQDS